MRSPERDLIPTDFFLKIILERLMIHQTIENLNIFSEDPLPSPRKLKESYPLSLKAIETVEQAQQTVKNILDRTDPRLLAVVGPCSIHDVVAARDYAHRLKQCAEEVSDTIYVVMRVYFEKPRTRMGWQGLINDPYLDGSCQIEDGLKLARGFLLELAELGMPAAGEALDLVSPPYVQDLIAWTAIGARTTESQNHRKMASGLSSAVGFKNGTDGNIEIALNAMQVAAHPSNFLSIDPEGQVAIIRTKGNPYSHMVLRGGNEPNYDAESVKRCEQKLLAAGVPANIMIDCSHANCQKDYSQQTVVAESLLQQIVNGNQSIIGLMVESHLNEGNQSIPQDLTQLQYGVSVTDPCLNWQSTEALLHHLHQSLRGMTHRRVKSFSTSHTINR